MSLPDAQAGDKYSLGYVEYHRGPDGLWIRYTVKVDVSNPISDEDLADFQSAQSRDLTAIDLALAESRNNENP